MRVVASGLIYIVKKMFWIWLNWWPVFVWITLFSWFAVFFEPLKFSDASLREIGNGNFRYTNISRKNWPADSICHLESATVVVDSDTQRTIYEPDNSPGKGTGSSDWKAWPHEGKIPATATVIKVHKVLEYTCLGITKRVRTPERILSL